MIHSVFFTIGYPSGRSLRERFFTRQEDATEQIIINIDIRDAFMQSVLIFVLKRLVQILFAKFLDNSPVEFE